MLVVLHRWLLANKQWTLPVFRRQKFAFRPSRPRKTHVQRGERQVKRFGDCDIPSVIAREVVTKLPDSLCEGFKGEQLDVEQHQILMRTVRVGRSEFLCPFQPPENICRLDPHQLRGGQGAARQDPLRPCAVRTGIDKRSDNNR
jgi:hypothetical protein